MSTRGQGRVFTRKDSSFYWVAYYAHGKEQRECARHVRTGDRLEVGDSPEVSAKARKEAERFLKHRLGEIAASKHGGRAFIGPQQERVTVSELLDLLEGDYKFRGVWSGKIASDLKPVREHFGVWRAVEVTPEAIRVYIESLRDGEEPYANASINRRTQLLEQAFGIGIQEKKISEMPSFKRLRLSEKDNVRQGYPTETQFAAVIENLPDDLRDFVSWCGITGMRRGEAKSLRWSMVNGNELQIPATICKNGIARQLPLNAFAEVLAIIERRRAARIVEVNGTTQMSEFIFHRGGERVGEFYGSWETAVRKAGCPWLIFHDLRRFACRNLVNAGVPMTVAKEWSGHKTLSMFMRYAIGGDMESMKAAAAKVEEYRKAVAATEKSNLVAMR
jgi:integrase